MLDLILERPLAFVDIESTGTNPRLDRIVELGVITLQPDGGRSDYVARFNPQIPIPPQVTAIHGISDQDVAGCPLFLQKAQEIFNMLDPCDLAGYNILRFDAVMLVEEFARAGLVFNLASRRVIDAQRIFHRKEPRDLAAAVAFFCGERLEGAHSALADAEAVIRVLAGELKRYPDLTRNVAGLSEFCAPPRDPAWADGTGKLKWSDGELVINFGVQYKGRRVKDILREKPKFLQWILTSDFPSDTKRIVADVLEGKFPEPPASVGGQKKS